MQDWAENKMVQKATAYQVKHPQARLHKKKMTCWHTTFGAIKVGEVVLEETGQTFRTFLAISGVAPEPVAYLYREE